MGFLDLDLSFGKPKGATVQSSIQRINSTQSEKEQGIRE
jgi:hypothetical protein